MKQKTLAITGIQRNQPQGFNEACDELINMRFQDGAWRPMGAKDILYPKPPYKPVVIHSKDNIRNWIGYKASDKTVNLFDPSSPTTAIQVIVTLNSTETLNAIRFLAQFLIIITTENLYRFYWKNNTYTRIQLTGIENNFQT